MERSREPRWEWSQPAENISRAEPVQFPGESYGRTRYHEGIHHAEPTSFPKEAYRTRYRERIRHADSVESSERIRPIDNIRRHTDRYDGSFHLGRRSQRDFHDDDYGGYYAFQVHQTREAYPTLANVRITTSIYYLEGLGREAWIKKLLEWQRMALPPQTHGEDPTSPPPPPPMDNPR